MKEKIEEYMTYHKDNYGLINEASYHKMNKYLTEIKENDDNNLLIGGNINMKTILWNLP